MFTLYRLTFSSGKVYIGQTSRPFKVRMNAHRTAANRGSMLPVHCAWRAHGEPTAEVICTLNTQDELNAAEVATIKALNTLSPHGYNISLGGDMAPSKNPEVAAKIAAKAKGRKHKDVHRWAESTRANWKDPEYREKVAAGVDASWTPERREKTSEKFKALWAKRKAEGWTMSEETREKLRKKVVTDESRAKMSESAKKRERKPQSDATRKKRSEMMKAIWAQRRGQ
jgi:hypothetical protein